MNVRKIAAQLLAAAALVAGMTAAAAAPAAAAGGSSSWPILDQNGRQVSTLIYNADDQIAMARYPPAGVRVTIEERFTTGQSAVRAVPERGCTVAMPYAGTGDVVAVRASVDDFANPWHEVG
jgi:hypothetical protein